MDIELVDMYKGRPSRFSYTASRKRSIYYQLSSRGLSEKVLETADDEKSSSLEKLMLRAAELMIEQKWQAVIELCDDGLQRQEDAELYNMKGRAEGKLGHVQQKIQLTKKAIQLNPGCPAYHRNLGAAYYKLQKYQLALQSHKAASTLQPTNSINHHNIGAVLYRLHRYPQAILSLRRSVQLNRYQAHSYRWLGNCYKEVQEFRMALDCYCRAYDLSEKELDRMEVERLEKVLFPWRVFFNGLLFC